mgnify:CR=1 FL=1
MAKRVYVVTVTGDKVINTTRSVSDLAKHLVTHGVDVTLDPPTSLGEAPVTHSNRMLHRATQTFSLWAHTDTLAFEISLSAGQQKACSRGRRFQSFCRTDWRARTALPRLRAIPPGNSFRQLRRQIPTAADCWDGYGNPEPQIS